MEKLLQFTIQEYNYLILRTYDYVVQFYHRKVGSLIFGCRIAGARFHMHETSRRPTDFVEIHYFVSHSGIQQT